MAVRDLDDVERVGYLGCVGEGVVENFAVRAGKVQASPGDPLPPGAGTAVDPRCSRNGLAAFDHVE